VPLSKVFEHAPANVLTEYDKVFGINFYVGGEPLGPQWMVLYLSVITVIFVLLSIWRVRKMKTN